MAKKEMTYAEAMAQIEKILARFRNEEMDVEYLADDELLEVTPKSLRMRKRQLDHSARMRALMKSRQ